METAAAQSGQRFLNHVGHPSGQRSGNVKAYLICGRQSAMGCDESAARGRFMISPPTLFSLSQRDEWQASLVTEAVIEQAVGTAEADQAIVKGSIDGVEEAADEHIRGRDGEGRRR